MKWNFGHIDFSTYPVAFNQALGAIYKPNYTVVRLWAPTATEVIFRLYQLGKGDCLLLERDMTKLNNGIWEIDLHGDYHGKYYTFQAYTDDKWRDEVPDPYAVAVGINGLRAMILDLEKTHPAEWENDIRVLPENYTDMVIYELHIRDFSVDPYSGIQQKGKFSGLTERGTRSPEGVKTGLDHLLELGITHVQLLPIFDFNTIDEERQPQDQYNWGYDPLNFNTPEGSYSSDPFDGTIRILELKKLIQTLHKNRVGVIMDVVYNHTALINHSWFNQIVPGYFYRQRNNGTFSDASGCGTEIASERAMVRKYIIDSVCFWASEYHIDGFRFDLMGIFDIETMNLIRKKLDEIDPRIVMYGEGWTAAESPMDGKFRAVKENTPKLDRIAMFNDDFRDAVKGHWGQAQSLGFASGQTLNEESVKYGLVAATFHPQIIYNYVASTKWAWSLSPQQSINYVSCHDNYTLYDKIKLSRPDASLQDLTKMVCLAGAILLTAQGIPFLHAGAEMLRTKKGHGNSYNQPDEINMIDWSRKALFSYVTNYFKQLITLRKNHPAFRMTSAEQIRNHLKFSGYYMPGVVCFSINDHANGDTWKLIKVIFNNNPNPIVFPLKRKKWKQVANGLAIDENGLSEHIVHSAFVQAYSMMILVTDDHPLPEEQSQ